MADSDSRDSDAGHGAVPLGAARSRRRDGLLILLAVLAVAIVAAGLLLRGDETENRLALAESRLRAASPDGVLSLDGVDVTELYVAPGALPGIALGDPLERATAAGLTRSGRYGEAGCWFLSPASHVEAANESAVPMPPVDWSAPSVTAWEMAGEIVSIQVHTPSGQQVPTWLGVGPGDRATEAAALPGASQQVAVPAPQPPPVEPAGRLALPVVTVPGADREGELEVVLAAAGDPSIVPDPGTVTTLEVRRPSAEACELPPVPQGMPLVPLPERPGPGDPEAGGAGSHAREERSVVGPTGTAEIPFGADVADLLAGGRWRSIDLGPPGAPQAGGSGEPGEDGDEGAQSSEHELLVPASTETTVSGSGMAHVDGIALVEAVDGAVTDLWLVEGGTSEGFAIGEPVSRLLEVYPGLTAHPGRSPGPPYYSGPLGDGRSLEAYPGDLPLDVPGVDVRLPLGDPPVVLIQVETAADGSATPP